MVDRTERTKLLNMFVKRSNLTQKEIAEIMGVSPVTVSYWCTGRAYPTKRNLAELAEILDVDVNDLTGFKPAPAPPNYDEFKLLCKLFGLTHDDIISFCEAMECEGGVINAAG